MVSEPRIQISLGVMNRFDGKSFRYSGAQHCEDYVDSGVRSGGGRRKRFVPYKIPSKTKVTMNGEDYNLKYGSG